MLMDDWDESGGGPPLSVAVSAHSNTRVMFTAYSAFGEGAEEASGTALRATETKAR